MELPDGVIVEGRLTEHEPDRLRIGMLMEAVALPLTTPRVDRGEVRTFAFRPVDQEDGQ